MMTKQRKLTYVFRCPECAKLFRSDEPGEPCCDGPSESSHDHPLEVMHLVKIEDREVGFGARRAEGKLIMPNDLGWIDEEAKAVLGESVLSERKLIILPGR